METSIEFSPVVRKGERIDEIGFGGYKLIQNPEEFCYGVDSVLLSDFAALWMKADADLVVDLGSGTGVIPLILCHKTKASQIWGIEIQESSLERAARSAQLNDVSDRVSFILGDVKDVKTTWGRDFKGRAGAVVSNPPYFKAGGAIRSWQGAKAAARHETTAGLEDFMECAAYLLRDKGDLFMVHRPARLVDICCFGRAAGLELKELIFVSPLKDAAANILLLHMVKGGGSELKILPPLAVYSDRGEYTEELLKAYERSK